MSSFFSSMVFEDNSCVFDDSTLTFGSFLGIVVLSDSTEAATGASSSLRRASRLVPASVSILSSSDAFFNLFLGALLIKMVLFLSLEDVQGRGKNRKQQGFSWKWRTNLHRRGYSAPNGYLKRNNLFPKYCFASQMWK